MIRVLGVANVLQSSRIRSVLLVWPLLLSRLVGLLLMQRPLVLGKMDVVPHLLLITPGQLPGLGKRELLDALCHNPLNARPHVEIPDVEEVIADMGLAKLGRDDQELPDRR